jgi:hypothetical protein
MVLAAGKRSRIHCVTAPTLPDIYTVVCTFVLLMPHAAVLYVLCCSPAFEQAKAQENYKHMIAQQAGQAKGQRFAAANEFNQHVQQQRAREEEEAHQKRVGAL